MRNEENLQQHIDKILATLDTQHAHGAEQQRPTIDEREAIYQQQRPQTIIDVYVIERKAAEEPPTVESTLNAPTQESQDDDESETSHTTPPVSRPKTRPKWYLLALVALCTLLIGAGLSIYLVQLFTPSASITIVTTSQQLTMTSTIELVTNGPADLTKNQVSGRELAAITMSQQKTVPTTGTPRQAAQMGHGIITFYNGATYSQTIPAGTVLIGADGVQLVTDADAILPAAVFPTFGQASIAAHAAITGAEGNVRAGDVYGACCRLNVSAVNGAFHGGQDARTYQSVTPQDINTVTSSIKGSLEQSIQTALQTQVQASEILIIPLSCTSKVTPDHQPGEEAAQVQVTVSEMCTGTTYTTQAVTALATQKATQDANTRLGTGYTTTGVQSRIVKTTPSNHGTLDLQVQSSSLWIYPFTHSQQDSMKLMIVGMRKDRATTTLLHLTGVQSVSIMTKNSTALPKEMQYISILFLQV